MNYVSPQESGTRSGLRWWRLTDDSGLGVEICSDRHFSASAIPFAIPQLDNGSPEYVRHPGDLVPDDVIIGLVTERLQDPDTEKGFILDGFPRTSAQAVALDAELSKLGRPLDAALLVDVDPEVIVKRLTSRRMCRDCNYIGTAVDETCPKCGGDMYQRDDDNEATVRNRLDVYEKSTAPLIDYYRGCDLLVSIDGDRDPNVVYADVKQALGL